MWKVLSDQLRERKEQNIRLRQEKDRQIGALKETDSILSLVHYVIKHDEAKKIMQEDYRNLPRRTKKQKRYYEQAKRKDRRAQIQRLDQLFDSLKLAATC